MIVLTLTKDELSAMVQDAVKVALIESTATMKPQPATNAKPVTTQELCEYLNVTEPTILRWRKRKKIPFFCIGSAIRFNLDAVLLALGADHK